MHHGGKRNWQAYDASCPGDGRIAAEGAPKFAEPPKKIGLEPMTHPTFGSNTEAPFSKLGCP